MLITKLYTNSQNIYSLVEYQFDGLPVFAPIWPLLAHPFAYRFTHSVYAPVQPNRSVHPDPVLGFHNRSGQC